MLRRDGVTTHKETVILVHGTWASPRKDRSQWYQRSSAADQSSFAAKLDRALAERGSTARCWAHCDDAQLFSWSGDNTWIGRARASTDLAACVNKLQDDGWRCHIVAHSHGGNIVAEALPAL